MQITIYELLGLVKDGKAPKKIKIDDIIYELDEKTNKYFTKMENYRIALGGLGEEVNLIFDAFENKVEILEEEKKIPEKIDMFDYFTGYDFSGTDEVLLKHLETNFETINETVNEIIGYLQYLKNKGDE